MPSALKGWHPGEVAIQRKLGFDEVVRNGWHLNEDAMREQHQTFHTSNLPFIPVTTFDDQGRPWASILAGRDGKIGFVDSPDVHSLVVKAKLWPGEPFLQTAKAWLSNGSTKPRAGRRFLTAGIGIELATRRRNKFAGHISDVEEVGALDYEVVFAVNQALGNCPKYINIRTLIPHPSTEPQIVYNTYNMEPGARLPKTVIDFITAADTIFVGTIYEAKPLDAQRFPSHAGMNARGGLPGFVRVKPSDGRTIIIPDYSGNRFMSSLGNIQASGLASMTIVSFSTGDVLYLTGSAQVLIGESALELMPRQATVCAIETTGFTLVRDAFPIRQAPATEVERSPYSPQIKYLREEPQALPSIIDAPIARLSNAVMVSEDIAILHFDVSYQSRSRLNVIPGQAIVLDFMDWMGLPNYQHMAANAPGSLNDDRVRTWTVSSGHEHYPVHEFDLTVREKKGGAVTGALFDVIRQHGGSRKYMQKMDFHALNISASVIGITGEFFLPVGSLNMLWVAGGIGVTPFIAMLAALSQRGSEARGELILALATREPTTFLRLIDSAMTKNLPNLRIQIDIFTTETAITIPQVSKMRTIIHKGHIQQSYWNTVAQGKDVYICGPAGFGDSAVDGLRVAGVASEKILREGFF